MVATGELGVDQRADVAGELLELGRLRRIGAEVALGVAHGSRLQRGVEAELAPRADDELGAAAADVDDQGPVGSRAVDTGAAVGEPRLLAPAEDPRVEREALAQLARKASPFEASRTALVASAATRSAPRSS